MNNGEQFFNTVAGGAGGYAIERSLRFNSSDSAYLSRTPASAGNRKTWTLSLWAKRSKLGGSYQVLISNTDASATNGLYCDFAADYFQLAEYGAASFNWNLYTAAVYRDTSAWYHIVCAVDTTQATASDRVKIWINGERITSFYPNGDIYPTLNYDTLFNTTALTAIGRFGSYSTQYYYDGYLADVHFIDGQSLDPTSFGEFDDNGIWQPIAYSGSYGTNGFHLPFSDNSTAAALGTDTSGNGNTWTVNNISVAAGAGNDSLVDVPTNGTETDTGVGGEVRGNYATWNPTEATTSGTRTLTNGNLDALLVDANAARLTIPPVQASGKYQWEITIGSKTAAYYQMGLNLISMVYATGDLHATFRSDGVTSNTLSGSWSGTGVSYTSGDVITVAYDNSNNSCAFYKNGVYSATFTLSGTPPASLNFGVFYGGSGNTNYTLNAGQRPFAHPVSGFKALNTANLPAPVVTKPSEYMDIALYTGNGGTQSISGLEFSPDLVWIKEISGTKFHALCDSVRGDGLLLYSNSTLGEQDIGSTVVQLATDGFNLGFNSAYTAVSHNWNGITHAAWTWDAGSSTVSNTDGSITSSVRANPSAGFSIVTADNVGSGTIGHGLGVNPSMIIIKTRDVSGIWNVQGHIFTNPAADYLRLNQTTAKGTDTNVWNNTAATSSVFSVNATYLYGGTPDLVAYCFAPVDGYSSFGSYTGNGSTDGPFVYTGFRPKFVLIKTSSIAAQNWYILDSARDLYNLTGNKLEPNTSNQENASPNNATTNSLDFLSNGFKLRTGNDGTNQSSATYIYAAFAEHPFQYARAR